MDLGEHFSSFTLTADIEEDPCQIMQFDSLSDLCENAQRTFLALKMSPVTFGFFPARALQAKFTFKNPPQFSVDGDALKINYDGIVLTKKTDEPGCHSASNDGISNDWLEGSGAVWLLTDKVGNVVTGFICPHEEALDFNYADFIRNALEKVIRELTLPCQPVPQPSR